MRIRVLVILGLLAAGVPALAHEAIDPVCGMTVSTDDARWKADYGGKTYYFCVEADRDAFLAAPTKFTAVLAVSRLSGEERLSLVVTPATAVAGDVVRIAIAPGLDLARAEARLYHVDRTAPPLAAEAVFHRLEDGALAFQRTLGAAGEWRVVIEAVRGTERLRAIFAIPLAERPPATAHSTKAAASGALPMAEQHENMRRIGLWWADLGWAIAAGGSREISGSLLAGLDVDATQVPRFTLHQHGEAKAEFVQLAEGFRGGLGRLRSALERGDAHEIDRTYRAVDLESCTRCHLKFRFALVEDLSRFPAVRPAALGVDEAPR